MTNETTTEPQEHTFANLHQFPEMPSMETVTEETVFRPPKGILYGTAGIGKTTWGANAPKPFFLLTEDGLHRALDKDGHPLAVPHWPVFREYEQVMEGLRVLLMDDHPHKTVVVDAAESLEELIRGKVAQVTGKPFDHDYARGDKTALPYWRQFTDALDRLRNERGMGVILLSHDGVEEVTPPDNPPYKRYTMRVSKYARGLLTDWADFVLLARFKTYTTTSEAGFSRTVTRGIGGTERVVLTAECASHVAKNPYRLPEEIPLDFSVFQKAFLAAQPKQPKKPKTTKKEKATA